MKFRGLGGDQADVGANAPKELATATLESVVADVAVTNVLGEMSPKVAM